MLYHNVRVMGSALRIVDAAGFAATMVGVWLWGANQGAWDASTRIPATFCTSISFVAFVLVAVRLGAYRPRRTEHIYTELISLMEVIVAAFALAAAATQMATAGLPHQYYSLALGSSLLVGLVTRWVMRVVIRVYRRRGEDYRVWLVIGWNARVSELVKGVYAHPHFGIRIEEIIDLPPDTIAAGEAATAPIKSGSIPYPFRTVRDVEDIREIVSTRVIDEVVVMLPHRTRYDQIQALVSICGEAGISVKVTPQLLEQPGHSYHLSEVGAIPFLTHFTGPSNYRLLILKRALDVVGSLLGLIILSPVLLVSAIAVRLGSRGPVLFRQERVGLHGRRFQILKFRSMVVDAESRKADLQAHNVSDGIAFKMKNDPRITTIGRWLRKFHIDELPQLWNVLVGDMSLVGPRPLPPDEAAGNEWWQRRRLTMPPGMTCLWQLQRDHAMRFRDWVNLDLQYIDKWSLWLDLRLIIQTVPVLLRGKGW